MRKTITIGAKSFDMQSSAFTSFKYRDETGRVLLTDLQKLGSKFQDIDKESFDSFNELEDFLTLTLRIAYIMSLEAKSITGSFEDFLKQIDDYLDNTDWVSEVIELAISPLSRNLQATQNK